MQNIDSLVKQLVATDGEDGVCPTAESWREIFRLGGNNPIHIINLLKFKHRLESADGPIAGAVAYAKYSAGVGGAFSRVGGKRLYFRRFGHMFGFGPVSDWDAAIGAPYPPDERLARLC